MQEPQMPNTPADHKPEPAATEERTGSQKLMIWVLIVIVIALMAVILWLVLPLAKTSNDSSNNNAAAETTPEPSLAPVYLNTLEANEKNALLFFASKLDDPMEFQALIYNAETDALVAEKEFSLEENIKDSYFGNNTALDPGTGDVYVSTVVSGPSNDEYDQCFIDRFVATGCTHKLYRLSMLDDSQELIYEAENLFAWKLTPDRHTIVIAEQVEPDLSIRIIDLGTDEIIDIASFADISTSFRLADAIGTPLGVSIDSSQLYLVMNQGTVGSETGWSVVIRAIDLETGAHTDTTYEGPETRLLQHASFSNYSDRAALVYSKVVNNSFVNWLFTMNLSDYSATEVADFDANNVTVVWGGEKKLFWQGKSKDLYSYDFESTSISKLPITPNAKVLPVVGSFDGGFLLYQNIDSNHHFLYSTTAETAVDLGDKFVADSYSGHDNIGTTGVQWLVAGGE